MGRQSSMQIDFVMLRMIVPLGKNSAMTGNVSLKKGRTLS